MLNRLALLILGLSLIAPPLAAERKVINPPEFKKNRPNSPFSPGILVDNTLYVAGQTGGDLETGEYPQEFEQEVHATFKRIGMILKEAGYDFSDVVDAKVYLTDMAFFSRMNSVFTQYFKTNPPVRTTVGVAGLAGQARIEITVIAAK